MRADPRNVSPKVELAREEAHYARHVKRLQRIHATINTSAPVTPPHIEFARQSMQRDRIYAERMSRILFSEIPGNGKKKRKVDTPDGNLPKWYYHIAQQQSAKFSTKRQEFVSLYGSKNTSGSASPGGVPDAREATEKAKGGRLREHGNVR